jgi:small subunit ribosomal protein S6
LAVNVYEGLFIFDSNKYSKDPTTVSGHIATLVQQHGGKILASRLWEERRLAYPINGQRKGTYWLSYFNLDSLQLAELNRQLALDENIMRSLVLKIDARIAETLVSHALSGGKPVVERHAPVAAVAAVGAEIEEDEE